MEQFHPLLHSSAHGHLVVSVHIELWRLDHIQKSSNAWSTALGEQSWPSADQHLVHKTLRGRLDFRSREISCRDKLTGLHCRSSTLQVRVHLLVGRVGLDSTLVVDLEDDIRGEGKILQQVCTAIHQLLDLSLPSPVALIRSS
ncbi:hypothetical protein RvY_00859 [Ramazzottius varieornatus]|uniref:Uncharacterized protein n=1 Tax=Ramazzottius varieornatus TaxID=947166 RepID=A0A1D1UP17_RAMVA|nr:hypothetical protein RvY_00859 [Ramazzottius varieornatus]